MLDPVGGPLVERRLGALLRRLELVNQRLDQYLPVLGHDEIIDSQGIPLDREAALDIQKFCGLNQLATHAPRKKSQQSVVVGTSDKSCFRTQIPLDSTYATSST